MKRSSVFNMLSLAGLCGLLATILLWHAWLKPPGKFPVALFLIVLLSPLLLALRGLLHGRAYTHAWASMLSLFYFCLGVMHAWSGAQAGIRSYGMALTIFSVIFFSGAVFYVRCSRIEARS
ncbi:MAG TPA: DUF2069 domain-containing protein [Gammaproteobacteria bacterium]|nr:DUF2069 domain-containing protein [Gammaproteobacteria bacterium]